MKDRVFGIENEFGIMVEKKGEGVLDFDSFSPAPCTLPEKDRIFYRDAESLLRVQLITAASLRGVRGRCLAGGTGDRLWLGNGGCFYIDTGNHPEYASPECRRVRDAVLYNKAGEKIALKIWNEWNTNNERFVLFKNNTELDGTGITLSENLSENVSFGCHENYLTYGKESLIKETASTDWAGSEDASREIAPLVAFLVTRQIIDGSGGWVDTRTGAYCFSPRALFLNEVFSISTTSVSPRGILNTRSEHHLGDGKIELPGMYRLHLIAGDPNILEFALFMKIGMTALVLPLIETMVLSGAFPRIANPVKTIQDLSCSCDPRYRVRFINGSSMTALKIQEILCEAAGNYLRRTTFESEESADEAFLIQKYWEETLTALARNDEEWMVGRLDWATNKFLAEERIRISREKKKKEGRPLSQQTIRSSVDLLYRRLDERGLGAHVNRRWKAKRILSDDEILRATVSPPQDTRARIRGEVVSSFEKGDPGDMEISRVDWGSVCFQSKTGYTSSKQVLCRTSNPLSSHAPWFDKIMRGEWKDLELSSQKHTWTPEPINLGMVY